MTTKDTSAAATVTTMKVRTLKARTSKALTLKDRPAMSPRATVAFSVLDLVTSLREVAQSALVSLRGRSQAAVAIAIPSVHATR